MERDLELGKNSQTQAHCQANASPVWRPEPGRSTLYLSTSVLKYNL